MEVGESVHTGERSIFNRRVGGSNPSLGAIQKAVMIFDEKLKEKLPYLTFVRDAPDNPNGETFWDFQYAGQDYTIAYRPSLKMYGLWRESQQDGIGFTHPDERFNDVDLFIARIKELWPEVPA